MTNNADFIVSLLNREFPGVRVKSVERLGGKIISFVVWNFKLEISVTTSSPNSTDTKGSVSMIFRFQDLDSKVSYILGQVQGNTEQSVIDFVEWVKSYIQNTAGTLLLALKEKD